MKLLSLALIAVVALEHLGFLALEMFLWDHPIGRRIFRLPSVISSATRGLAANMGLYNGFLAAGLVWSLASDRLDLKVFFLACVIVAGVFGAATVSRRILFVQAVPAALALLITILAA